MSSDRRSSFAAWVLAGGSAFLLFLFALFAAVYVAARDDDRLFSLTSDRIGLVALDGEIFGSRAVVEDLEHLAKDRSVRAIVLRLNSPGGAVAPSQEIYAALRRLRQEHKKPVWASIGIVGASGAYYIACAADRIYANPGSLTGSIGVIAEWYNYGELLQWAKMKDVVYKSGKMKDAGSPTREPTPEEKAYLQSLVEEMHGQFVAAVAEGRKKKVEEVRGWADGRVFTGQQAAKLGMIDGVAGLDQVIEEAGKAVGIKGRPRVVTPPRERRTLLDTVFEGVTRLLPPAARDSLVAPYSGKIRFQYLWR